MVNHSSRALSTHGYIRQVTGLILQYIFYSNVSDYKRIYNSPVKYLYFTKKSWELKDNGQLKKEIWHCSEFEFT